MRRPRITYANAMATLALVLALGGTAVAAGKVRIYTGATVVDNSLTASHVKDGSLVAADLSAGARASFTGEKGPAGAAGSRGPTGVGGARGADGPRGTAALMTSAFAWRDTGLVTQRVNSLVPNDGPGSDGTDWDAPNYASAASGGPYPNIRQPGSYESIALTAAWTPVLALNGMGGADAATRSADTWLRVTFADSVLNATGTVTLLHRANGESLTTHDNGTLRHGRVQCALFTGTDADPAALATQAGVPGWASSGTDALNHELVQVALNGSTGGIVAGTSYNTAVKCRDADYTGSPQWQAAGGNLTVLASQ